MQVKLVPEDNGAETHTANASLLLTSSNDVCWLTLFKDYAHENAAANEKW